MRLAQLVQYAALGMMVAVGGAMSAAAQQDSSTPPSVMFERPSGDDGVAVWSQAGATQSGLRRGAFLIEPSLTLVGEFNDNIFATAANEESDFIVSVTPEVVARSTWSRHALAFSASATQRQYFDFEDESVFTWDVGADGRLDVVRGAYFEGGLGYAELTEARTSSGAAGFAAEPIEYSKSDASLAGVREYGRWRAEAGVARARFDYDDTALPNGTPVDQDFRDRDELTYTLRGDYAVSPDTSVFLRARFMDDAYDQPAPPLAPLNRDSDGYAIELGSSFDITNLIAGEVSVGYTERDYADPTQVDQDGLAFSAGLSWAATPLTQISVSASRAIQASAVGGSAGVFTTEANIRVDHELRRDVVVTAGLTLGDDEYATIDRDDQRFGANLGVAYNWTDNASIRVDYQYTEQSSGGLAGNRDYERNALMVSLVLRP